MASRKSDIEVHSLATDEELASQLRAGQQVRLVQVEDSPEVHIHSDQGSLIGVVVDSPVKEQLVTGKAVIRSLRKQNNLLVHVLIRVIYPESHAAPRQGRLPALSIPRCCAAIAWSSLQSGCPRTWFPNPCHLQLHAEPYRTRSSRWPLLSRARELIAIVAARNGLTRSPGLLVRPSQPVLGLSYSNLRPNTCNFLVQPQQRQEREKNRALGLSRSSFSFWVSRFSCMQYP